ncbi:MAG: hypothetical protein OCC45_06895 [Desulfotalea sp.]
MDEFLTKAQSARKAIATFKTIADAMLVAGYFEPYGDNGKKLTSVLKEINPEIFGTMNDPRKIELGGLEYVINRLPKGIEKCIKIVMTTLEDFDGASFEKLVPLKRRRLSYAVADDELCFIITRGESELYDILTHVVFLLNEADKIREHIFAHNTGMGGEWQEIKRVAGLEEMPDGKELDQAVWSLSKFLGRSFASTRATFDHFEKSRLEQDANGSLFSIIYNMGLLAQEAHGQSGRRFKMIYTPALYDMIIDQQYAQQWAISLKNRVVSEGLKDRPIHLVSANLHSFSNLLYGYEFLKTKGVDVQNEVDMIGEVQSYPDELTQYAKEHGCVFLTDDSGSNIDAQIFDVNRLTNAQLNHLSIKKSYDEGEAPVIIVIDYAFGTQAFKILDELLRDNSIYPYFSKQIASFSVMGKAGILAGKKGDIMLANAHVLEGTPDNYSVQNDVTEEDFAEKPDSISVCTGSMLTVLGTSLQNSSILERLFNSSWGFVGLEMEGGHYQRAIGGGIIRKFLSKDIHVRYIYYASDNPLMTGETLASGAMGKVGLIPTYLISKVILRKIFSN